jgi:pimeloyl-ACP methyl ester carboxylesterase
MNMDMSSAWFGDGHFDDVDILPSLAGVRCPSFVITGKHDFICGPAWNRPIAASIPAARYVEIADTGHIPQHEQPEAFRAALLDGASRHLSRAGGPDIITSDGGRS